MAQNQTNQGGISHSRADLQEKHEHNLTPRILVQADGNYAALFGDPEGELSKTVKEAARLGYQKMQNPGGSAVDAAEAAVRVLEDSAHFNAGRGSLPNNSDEVECDAMIMDGHTMNTGAVIAGRHFKNPVAISRKIMEKSHHCALVGDGAKEFAEKNGFDICEPEYLKTTDKKFRYKDYVLNLERCYKSTPIPEATPFPEATPIPGTDTVTAIALDAEGHFACATSTGGIPGKLKGRVGDAPLVGCGGYANEYGAAASSGHGEALMKMTLAREVVHNMEKDQDAQTAVYNAVKRMKDRINGYGGATAIDRNGKFGIETTSAVLIYAFAKDGEVECGLKRKEKI